jgi:predicted GTPase
MESSVHPLVSGMAGLTVKHEARKLALDKTVEQINTFVIPFFKELKDDQKLPSEFNLACSQLKRRNYELVVIGNTNVGKSTFLNMATKMKDFFNISNNRETSCIWRFQVDPSQTEPFIIEEVRIKPESQTMEKIEGVNRRAAQT